MDRGTLYVVSTPIGNLSDLTARAREIFERVGHVAAEDTRRTRALLSHLGLGGKTLHRVDAHSRDEELAWLAGLLERGESVALATDAGTPAVSDPGSALVRLAVARGVPVVPIPGASAVLAALVASGLSDDSGFRFLGFLPRDGPSRRAALLRAVETPEPVVLFESPHRLEATLAELASSTPARPAAIARELTKLHEEIVRGALSELAALRREWQGEIVLVLGSHDPGAREEKITDLAIDARIDEELERGAHAKGIAERLAAWSGRPRRALYERVIARKSR